VQQQEQKRAQQAMTPQQQQATGRPGVPSTKRGVDRQCSEQVRGQVEQVVMLQQLETCRQGVQA
jgi:hypothetical protein